jgi:RNase P subunit RPR2
MVKVINPEPDKRIAKQAPCRNCGALLEYVPNDVQTGQDTDYTGSSDSYQFITCPNCGNGSRL